MNTSFREFMTGLIDYAGLFPPAALDMATAVANYDRYRRDHEAWMLGRFICPAARLSEMQACLPEGFAAPGPWSLSVLVGDQANTRAALETLPRHLAAISELEGHHGGQVEVPAMESPLPPDAHLPDVQPLDFLARASQFLDQAGLAGREVYWELPASGNASQDRDILAGIKEMGFAAKFRCGGVTADAFPELERLAAIIQQCQKLELPLKMTAGLHHPVRHQATEPQVMMNGFLNVFGAGVLAHGGVLDLGGITECLADTESGSFSFDEAGFSWRDNKVSSATVRAIRNNLLPGFGSCSFAEPRADLRELGWL